MGQLGAVLMISIQTWPAALLVILDMIMCVEPVVMAAQLVSMIFAEPGIQH
jgi:hypothetical protein